MSTTPKIDTLGQGRAAEAPTVAPLLCRKLRTKLSFSAMVTTEGDPVAWQAGDGSSAVYWCLKTMECAGPDGALVHAQACGAAPAGSPGGPDSHTRACYIPPVGDETVVS